MVLSGDGGQKMVCPKCHGVIKHKEQSGAVDDGRNMQHCDCWRDEHGYESAMDMKWQRELQRKRMEEQAEAVKRRSEAWARLRRWANVGNQPRGKYGARKIA